MIIKKRKGRLGGGFGGGLGPADYNTWALAWGLDNPIASLESINPNSARGGDILLDRFPLPVGPNYNRLGDKKALLANILNRIDTIDRVFGIPRIEEVRVAGTSFDLAIPQNGLNPNFRALLIAAAEEGIDEVSRVINDTSLEQSKTNANLMGASAADRDAEPDVVPNPDADSARAYLEDQEDDPGLMDDIISTQDQMIASDDAGAQQRNRSGINWNAQSAGAVASTMSEVTALFTEEAGNTEPADQQRMQNILQGINAAASICDVVAGIVGGIAGAVLEIIAILCRIVTAILEAIRRRFQDPGEGWNSEWNNYEMMLILQERLRMLVDCGDGDWDQLSQENFNVAMGFRDHDQIQDFLRNALDTIVHGNMGRRNREHALYVCNALGAGAVNYGKLVNIQQWLFQAGFTEAEAQDVFTYMYDSLMVTRMVERREFLGANHAASEGSLVWVRQDKEPVLCSYDRAGDDAGQKPNMLIGTPKWFAQCHGLKWHESTATDGSTPAKGRRWIPFGTQEINDIYMTLKDRLKVIPLPEERNVAKYLPFRYPDPNKLLVSVTAYIRSFRGNFPAKNFPVETNPIMLKIPALAGTAVPDYKLYCAPGVLKEDIRTAFGKDHYFWTRAHGIMWGCLIDTKDVFSYLLNHRTQLGISTIERMIRELSNNINQNVTGYYARFVTRALEASADAQEMADALGNFDWLTFIDPQYHQGAFIFDMPAMLFIAAPNMPDTAVHIGLRPRFITVQAAGQSWGVLGLRSRHLDENTQSATDDIRIIEANRNAIIQAIEARVAGITSRSGVSSGGSALLPLLIGGAVLAAAGYGIYKYTK